MNRREFITGAGASVAGVVAAEAAFLTMLAQPEAAQAQAEKTETEAPANWAEGGVAWELSATETLPAENPAEGVLGGFVIVLNEVQYMPANWGTAKLIADMSPVGLSIFFEPTPERQLEGVAVPADFAAGAEWQLIENQFPQGAVQLSNLQEIQMFFNDTMVSVTSLEEVRQVLAATDFKGAALYVVNKEIVSLPTTEVAPPQNWGESDATRQFDLQPLQRFAAEFEPKTAGNFDVSIGGVMYTKLRWEQVQGLTSMSTVGASVWYMPEYTSHLPEVHNNS